MTTAVQVLEEHTELPGTARQLHLTLAGLLPEGETVVTVRFVELERLMRRNSTIIYRSIDELEETGLWKREKRANGRLPNLYHALFLA